MPSERQLLVRSEYPHVEPSAPRLVRQNEGGLREVHLPSDDLHLLAAQRPRVSEYRELVPCVLALSEDIDYVEEHRRSRFLLLIRSLRGLAVAASFIASPVAPSCSQPEPRLYRARQSMPTGRMRRRTRHVPSNGRHKLSQQMLRLRRRKP